MIYCYSGTPGSGKSLHAADRVLNQAKKADSTIIANTPFNLPKGTKARYVQIPQAGFTVDDVLAAVDLSKPIHEGQYLLVIDEAQLMFNSRDWNDKQRRRWILFFTQHRKLGFDVILIAQSLDMLDKQIRAVVETDVEHFKFNNLGYFGWFLDLVLMKRPLIRCRYRSTCFSRKAADNVYMRYWFVGTKRLYRVYDTFDMFGALSSLTPQHGTQTHPRARMSTGAPA